MLPEHKQQNGEKRQRRITFATVCSRMPVCRGRMRACRGGGVSVDVIGPCLSSWLMAIGHRLSPLYFFCSPALSSQVSHWSSALRHRIIYCCQESQWRGGRGEKRGEWKGGGGGLQEERETGRRCAAERIQWRQWVEAGTLDCQISAFEYLMEPGVFI